MPGQPAGRSTIRHFDELLLAALHRVCEDARAREASDERLPTRPVPCLVRTTHGLEAGTREAPDWQAVLAALSRRPGFWPAMTELAAALADDPHVDADVG